MQPDLTFDFAKGMRKIPKILLVLDSWMLRCDAGTLLGGLGLAGADVVFYHVTDYSEAIASSGDPYNETILPGAGITPIDQFVDARKTTVEVYSSQCRQYCATRNTEVEVHPQPARKILEKAETENVDLIVVWIRDKGPEQISKSVVIEEMARRSARFVLALIATEVPDATAADEAKIEVHLADSATWNTELNELRQDVYSTADHTPLICESCRHPLDLHTGRHCSVCNIFPDFAIGRRCLQMVAPRQDNEA